MEQYIDANNSRGTHATDANGASTATPTDAPNTFFGAINGAGQGDNWLAKTTVDTTQPLGTEQNFWFLTTSSTSNLAQATKTPFGVDLNHDGSITGDEFSKFNLNANGALYLHQQRCRESRAGSRYLGDAARRVGHARCDGPPPHRLKPKSCYYLLPFPVEIVGNARINLQYKQFIRIPK